MKHIQCPEVYSVTDGLSVFLAGGISGCSDWQKDFVTRLSSTDLVLINPRRVDFDVNDKVMTRAQILWEHEHMKAADSIAFWFPCETLCPITLYELGKVSAKSLVKLFIGIHPDYARKIDVEIQTELERHDVDIVYSLDDLAKQIIDWI